MGKCECVLVDKVDKLSVGNNNVEIMFFEMCADKMISDIFVWHKFNVTQSRP